MTEDSQMRSARNAVISVVVAFALGLLAIGPLARLKWHAGHAASKAPQRTRPVAIDLLPSFVKVFEKDGYSHPFSIPSDATNAHLEGEFIGDPRPQTHVDMLVITAAGRKNWRDFLLSPIGANNNTANGELLYHSGTTNADYFQIKMTPGEYLLIFDYGPSTRTSADHYVDLDALGRNYRLTSTKITLNYDLPAR
jgi:hypothetical protein